MIRNVRVFDGTGMSELRTVVIDGELIGRDPTGAHQIIDGEGGYLVPGLIDAHVHVHTGDHLQQLLIHGVTTALDMAMWPAEKMQLLRGQEGLPDLRTAGLPATKAGSVHSCVLPLPQEAFLSSPEQAVSWVKRRIDEGSDYIKIIADVPGPDQSVMNAISAEARQRGKMVVAHAASYNPFSMALEAKVDVVTHVACDKAVDTDLAERMVASRMIAVPVGLELDDMISIDSDTLFVDFMHDARNHENAIFERCSLTSAQTIRLTSYNSRQEQYSRTCELQQC